MILQWQSNLQSLQPQSTAGRKFMKHIEPKAPTYVTPGFLILRNRERINVGYFKFLSVGGICYTAVDN